jgi:hypothetical protein
VSIEQSDELPEDVPTQPERALLNQKESEVKGERVDLVQLFLQKFFLCVQGDSGTLQQSHELFAGSRIGYFLQALLPVLQLISFQGQLESSLSIALSGTDSRHLFSVSCPARNSALAG